MLKPGLNYFVADYAVTSVVTNMIYAKLYCCLCDDLHVLYHTEYHKLLWQYALALVACSKNNCWNLKRRVCVVSHMFILTMTNNVLKKNYFLHTS